MEWKCDGKSLLGPVNFVDCENVKLITAEILNRQIFVPREQAIEREILRFYGNSDGITLRETPSSRAEIKLSNE